MGPLRDGCSPQAGACVGPFAEASPQMSLSDCPLVVWLPTLLQATEKRPE